MNNNNNPITEFDLTIIEDFFCPMHRQGPGDDSQTLLALELAGPLPEKARIADVGCGTGTPTLALAKATDARITGIDMLPGMIEKFNERVTREGLSDRVKGVVGTMDALPFNAGELDVIWAEGSIASYGFIRALRDWKPLLADGGVLVASLETWLTPHRPAAIEEYWNVHTPDMATVQENLSEIENAGYLPTAHFILPAHYWDVNFYEPLIVRIAEFLKEKNHSHAAQAFARAHEVQIDYWRRYGAYYGYVFYICRKL